MDWKYVALGIIFILAVLIYSVLAAITRYSMRDDKNRPLIMQIFSFLWIGLTLLVAVIGMILCVIAKILISI